jgi:hypothetical protein
MARSASTTLDQDAVDYESNDSMCAGYAFVHPTDSMSLTVMHSSRFWRTMSLRPPPIRAAAAISQLVARRSVRVLDQWLEEAAASALRPFVSL